ncbi:hypothetical protein BDN67DRAFT_984861 [Paxillus ammoniavirescens]|nr:hypothetical protein BDN67DRAFT_984861 [Paxillus ammoniavirescens]
MLYDNSYITSITLAYYLATAGSSCWSHILTAHHWQLGGANGHNIIQMSLPPLSLSYEEIVEHWCQAIARVKDSMQEADANFEFYKSEIVNISGCKVLLLELLVTLLHNLFLSSHKQTRKQYNSFCITDFALQGGFWLRRTQIDTSSSKEDGLVVQTTIMLMYCLVIVWKLSRVPFIIIPFHDTHQIAMQKSQLSPLSGSLSTWAIANGNPPKCGRLQQCVSLDLNPCANILNFINNFQQDAGHGTPSLSQKVTSLNLPKSWIAASLTVFGIFHSTPLQPEGDQYECCNNVQNAQLLTQDTSAVHTHQAFPFMSTLGEFQVFWFLAKPGG